MAFKVFTVGEVFTASDANAMLMTQVLIRCSSGTRPASPAEGWHIYETDTDKFLFWDGAAWQTFARKQVPVVTVNEGTDIAGFTSTTFTQGSPVCGVAFAAPPTGQVTIIWHARFEPNTAVRVLVSIGVRAGGTVGSGADEAVAADNWSIESTATADARIQASAHRTIVGLTPGSTYNVVTEHKVSAAGNGDIYDRAITVIPSP